jgi:hypothetical protein
MIRVLKIDIAPISIQNMQAWRGDICKQSSLAAKSGSRRHAAVPSRTDLTNCINFRGRDEERIYENIRKTKYIQQQLKITFVVDRKKILGNVQSKEFHKM